MVEALQRDYRSAPISDQDRIMLDYVVKLTKDATKVSPADHEKLRAAGFDARVAMYDFGSSPLAGLFPGWRAGYRMARAIDDVLLGVPVFRRRGSNFEVIAR